MARAYPLNCTEKSILAWERPGQAFNSHFVLEFKNPLELDQLKRAVQTIFAEIPLLRTRIYETHSGASREAVAAPASELLRQLTVREKYDPEDEENFLARPFQLNAEPPLRVYYCSEPAQLKLILSVHHTAADGGAQAFLLNEFFRAYEGLKLTPWTREFLPFRFRSFFLKEVGLISVALAFFAYLKDLMKLKPYNAACFLDEPHPKSREVRVQINDLNASQLQTLKDQAAIKGLSQNEFLLFAVARVAHQLCAEKNENQKPVTLMVPVNYRFVFKMNRYFQNATGMNRLVIPRSVLENAPAEFKPLLDQHLTVRKSFRVVFMAILLNLFLTPAKSREKIKRFDENPEHALASAIVSASRLPSGIHIPTETGLTRIYGRGALFRSPGLGVIMTGTKTHQTLVIEYLKDAFRPSTIQKFQTLLWKELGLN